MNELQLLPNPDNIPGAVSSGYQRQNTNIFTIQTGLDTTEPYDNGSGTITIPEGGIVEINGSLFKLTSTVTLTKSDNNIAYWVAVSDNGDGTANVELVTRPGIWNPAKQGCYRSDGTRTLNWISLGTPGTLSGTAVFSKTVKGTWNVALEKGWYFADLRSGLGGGNGATGGTGGAGTSTQAGPGGTGTGGGVASTYYSANKIFFYDGKIPLVVKVGGSGGTGGKGGNGGTGGVSDGGGGGGGGGGSGSGEASYILGLVNTASVKAGAGGYGGTGGTGTDYGCGGGGGGGNAPGFGGSALDGIFNGGTGSTSGGSGGSASGGRTRGGMGPGGVGGENGLGSTSRGGAGGGGGGQGTNGENQAYGVAGGYCNIYKLEN
jgi:hypothetical protein